jgi:predicted transcriptional regulator
VAVRVKEQVIDLVRSLPEEVTVDDIMRELYFKIQVDKGLKELDEGKGIPHQEVERRMSRWLSTGKSL